MARHSISAQVRSESLSTAAEDLDSVEEELVVFLRQKQVSSTGPAMELFLQWLRESLVGGKRFRPRVCCFGWRAFGGTGSLPRTVAQVAASLELFHAFALIHDDVMDNSETRHGRPAAHHRIAVHHASHVAAERLGVNTALLLGDLALGWSYDLIACADLHPGQARGVWSLLDTMRTHTLGGQYLDLLAENNREAGLEDALAIARYKTAVYTVEGPLRLGALLAGAPLELLSACSDYGLPVGEAFQLRDDLLGVFGDPKSTGKPTLDDLRSGKATALLVLARRSATRHQLSRLDTLVGDPALDETGAAEVREILTATGARVEVEKLIGERCQRAMNVVDEITPHVSGAEMLRHLALRATQRGI
jgi:geranylgeranyl diphosphate synthase, type I